jgi:hypothetical protein
MVKLYLYSPYRPSSFSDYLVTHRENFTFLYWQWSKLTEFTLHFPLSFMMFNDAVNSSHYRLYSSLAFGLHHSRALIQISTETHVTVYTRMHISFITN